MLVAAIGILAAIAIPTYQNFDLKRKINQAVVERAEPVRQQVARYYEQHRRWPSPSALAATDPRVSLREGGRVRLDLTGVGPSLDGAAVILVPAVASEGLMWVCRAELADEDQTRYLPPICRGDAPWKPQPTPPLGLWGFIIVPAAVVASLIGIVLIIDFATRVRGGSE